MNEDLKAAAAAATPELRQLAEDMVWAQNGNPFEYATDASPDSVYVKWVEMASPDRILALCDRVDELEPVIEAAFEFVDARAEWMAGSVAAARMMAAERIPPPCSPLSENPRKVRTMTKTVQTSETPSTADQLTARSFMVPISYADSKDSIPGASMRVVGIVPVREAVASLTAQLAEMKGYRDECADEMVRRGAQLEQERANVAALREALDGYGEHRPVCDVWQGLSHPCSCGFAGVESGLRS